MTNPLNLGGPPRPFTVGDVGFRRLGRKLAAAAPASIVSPLVAPLLEQSEESEPA